MKTRGPVLVSAQAARVVLVTAPSQARAERLARGILQKKLAACVSIVPRIRSCYRWKGKMYSEPEALMVIKTRKEALSRLHRWVREHHPYEVPEFLALPVSRGDSDYLKWLGESLP